MKKKIYLVIILIMLVTFFSGITYSFFHSTTSMTSSNQEIAGFIFEAKDLDQIDLNLNGIAPGEEREYLFSVTNKNKESISDVNIEYQLSIITYHFIPITIDLYQITDEKEILIGSCDEETPRNSENEIVCEMPINTLINSLEQVDNYKLKVSFPEIYNDVSYSNLVDFLNLEIKSWQKI